MTTVVPVALLSAMLADEPAQEAAEPEESSADYYSAYMGLVKVPA